MKCQNCGAEIGTNRFCMYCGSQITAEMRKEQEQLIKEGCPRCGSGNVYFMRENQGEIRSSNRRHVIHQTVGICRDCGYTYYPNGRKTPRKTWLWVLGWIFIFPLPLTLILIKKKELKPEIRYSIIAAAWIFFLFVFPNIRNINTTNTQVQTNKAIPSVASNEMQSSYYPVVTTSQPEQFSEEIVPEKSIPEETVNEDTTAKPPESLNETIIRPEIKEAIDSYERFVDEYCSFMESYDSSDFSLLTKYFELLSKEIDMTAKFEALEDDLTDAEALYYAEVSLRCSQKMLQSAASMN